jgi:phosphomannomutase
LLRVMVEGESESEVFSAAEELAKVVREASQ